MDPEKPNVDWSWDALEQAEQSARAAKKSDPAMQIEQGDTVKHASGWKGSVAKIEVLPSHRVLHVLQPNGRTEKFPEWAFKKSTMQIPDPAMLHCRRPYCAAPVLGEAARAEHEADSTKHQKQEGPMEFICEWEGHATAIDEAGFCPVCQ